MGRGEEGLGGIELKVAVVMPFLECKHGTLVVKKFRVKLILGGCWDEDDLVVVGVWRS